ncbi:MAG: hypothetical protein P9M08_03760 [Candidatus Erginobacter occultus]|nr:hypothetical protein [Candidatus Erginobacter occultus]
MPGRKIFLLALTVAALASGLNPAPATAGDYLVLETADPSGDREDILHPEEPYPGGDLRGARLVLRKVPIPRGPQTDEVRPGHVYVPVELTILIDSDLTGGEVQLCIFSHLPPLHIEQIISRDSIVSGDPEGEKRILLATQSETSLFTGMEEAWDREILAFQDSEHYPNCFFEAVPKERGEGLRQAAEFNFHSGTTYIFPPSPRFYWRNIPSLSVSTSLVVRELDVLTVGPVKSLVNDTLKSSWREVTGP